MNFLIEYLTKEVYDSVSTEPVQNYAGKTEAMEIKNTDWENVVPDALRTGDVHQVVAVHLRLNHWGKK